jgi:hypothetical protein
MYYSSRVVGLENYWQLWKSDSGKAVISIRGTTASMQSWLANFYAAMVPAQGTLRLSETDSFPYKLAADPKAAVHIGWLVSTAYLSKDIVPRIEKLYNEGIKDIFITGHSQGGAISYLITAHLYSLQKQGLLPSDIRFKTYCSAAPKPGNLYFAYEYEASTQDGWSYNVVNSADWVPESPFSIQTTSDFNTTNPFTEAPEAISRQKFKTRIALKHVYNKLDKPTRKAQRNFEKYLGDKAGNLIKKYLPDYQEPEYFKSNHYVRTGATIVLLADADYYIKYPSSNRKNVFGHHFPEQYLYLLDRW